MVCDDVIMIAKDGIHSVTGLQGCQSVEILKKPSGHFLCIEIIPGQGDQVDSFSLHEAQKRLGLDGALFHVQIGEVKNVQTLSVRECATFSSTRLTFGL